jgi:hypothetical protein
MCIISVGADTLEENPEYPPPLGEPKPSTWPTSATQIIP